MARKVAFQGMPGAYSDIAAGQYFSNKVTTVPFKGFKDVFAAVTKGSCDFGVVPIENSLAGSIHENYDLCLKNKLSIVGEIKLRVSHSLIVNPGVKIGQIRRIYSHPQALAQCAGFIQKSLKKAEPVAYFDTAASVKMIKENGYLDAAAIASEQSAKKSKMTTLKRAIEDNPENYTRFIVLSKLAKSPKLGVKSKSSIVFALKNMPGALHKAITVFANRDIDLVKIESRPLHGSPWKYLFYLDFAGHLKEERCERALAHLAEVSTLIRVLGCYPWAD